MGEDEDLVIMLRQRIMQLEERVESLRMSRRVLIHLIDRVEKEKRLNMAQLQLENDRLRKANRKLAKGSMSLQIQLALMKKEHPLDIH